MKKVGEIHFIAYDFYAGELTLSKEVNLLVTFFPIFLAVFSSEDDVIISEILWSIKCCVSNFSFASNEGNNQLFAKMFHDSKIASNYRMSYTKCQYVVEFALKTFILQNLCDDFRDTAFTFKFDESTTVQVKKQYDGHIQYYSKRFERVINHFCGSMFVGHCTSEQLRNHFFEFGAKLNWKINYLLHLGMDGPYVNKKFQEELIAELKGVHGKTILDVSTCSLHPVHNSFEKGLTKIAFDYDKFARNIYTFFKRSPARREDFLFANIDSELEVHFMRRHVATRWVSLKKAYVRINEQWDHLKSYFLEYLPKQKKFAQDIEQTDTYKFIASNLKNSETPIFVNFVIYLAGILESYLIPMESKQPKIHVMYTKIGELFHKLMSCFVKPSILLNERGAIKDAHELGQLDVTKYYRNIHDIELGTKAKYLIGILEPSKNVDHLKCQFRSCFTEITTYLQSHLPHKSIFLKDLTCLQPDKRKSSSSAPAIRRVAIKIANVLHNTKLTQLTPECFADEVMSEYRIYQSETFYVPDSEPDEPLRIDDYWMYVEKVKSVEGTTKFQNLVNLARVCLSISHGNADPERGFSENKIILDGRESLGEETIVAIRLVKQSVELCGGILNFPINRHLINLFKNARTAYEESQAMKKTKKTLEEASKQKDLALLNGKNPVNLAEIEKLISEEQSKIDAANSVLETGQMILQNALDGKTVKKESVVKANALIKTGMTNCKASKNKLGELMENKKKILEEMKKKKR